MVKNWVSVECIFREQGIYFELKNWFYLCLIQGRYFYYSPQTGKWRMKSKRAWQISQTPEDFITQAKAYSPPDYQSNQAQSQQKTYSYNSTTSKQHQKSTEDFKGISEEFLGIFDKYLQKQRENGYKIGWIWYKLKEEFFPSPLEICWLSVVFQYSPYWAVFKTEELYGTADRSTILHLIKSYQQEWLEYFQTRWGIKEKDKQHQQKQQTSRQRHSAEQTFVHQTYLKILGLTFPFTLQELKRAYRRRALETHPDSGGTAEAFRSVHIAYQTLSFSLQT